MSSSRVEAELGECVRRQAVLRDLGRRALEADDDGALLSEATAAVADALDVAYCGAFERRPGIGEAVLRAGVGWPDDRTGQATVPTDSDSLAGEALTSADFGVERADPQDGSPAPVAASGSATGIAVGVGPPDEPWGVLGAYAGTDREFTDRDAVFLENVANLLAPTVGSRSADASRDGPVGHIEGTGVEEVYERVSDAFFALDDECRFTYLNQQAEQLLGASAEELHGEVVWDALPEAVGTDLETHFRDAIDTQEPVSFERRSEPLDLWADVRVYPSETGLSVYVQDVSERKERERELEESERRYRTLVEHFPNGAVGLVDEDLHYRMVGGHPTKVANMTAEEIQGQPVREALPQPLADELAPRYEAALEGESRGFDVELDDRIYQVQIVPVRDDDGDIFAALGLSQDVTERERAQRKLATSERRYRTLVEHFPNGAVGLFDEDLRYTVAGGEILEEIGAPPEEIVGQTVQERYPQELVDQLEPNFQAALDGKTNSFEVEFHDRHWMAHTLPVRDGDGDIFAGMMMVQDVTDRKRRQRALRERERELQQHTAYTDDIFDAIDDLFYVVDESGTFRRWNRSLSEVTGYDDAEIESMYPLEFVVEEDRETIATGMAEVFESGGTRVEATVSTKDGERVPMEFVASALENPDGERVLAGIGRDITMRKERERQLQESNERLEQFAYAASHDLQEPLRMVSSYLRLIERRYADELDDDGREFIEFAVDGADRMREMIDALLQYSRVDTRGDPFEPVDLTAVFADVREDLRMKLAEHDAELTVEELPTVEGDGGQLRQLFQNLLENAVEYSGDAPPRVHVSAERRGDEWRLAVSDEGIGIDPDDADRVFEVFQSLHTNDEHEGTGIGLALCERIVERHGGEIRVDSTPGEGATFSFTLPAGGDGDE